MWTSVATSHPALQYLDMQMENLQVITCVFCGGFNTIYMELDNHGVPVWSHYNQEPDYLPDVEDVNSSTETPPSLVLSSEKQSPYYSAVWTMSQLGSQIDNADFDEYGEGIFYMFICPKDRITATLYQQS